MAEEKKIMEEKKQTVKQQESAKVVDRAAGIDEFNMVSSRLSHTGESVSNVPPHRIEDGRMIFKSTVLLQHGTSKDLKDASKEWDNFGVCFPVIRPDGTKRAQEMFFAPNASSEDIYIILQDIYTYSNGKCYVEFVRVPVIEDNEVIGYRYDAQVSYRDEFVDLVCPLKPKYPTDRIVFKNLVAQLRVRNELI